MGRLIRPSVGEEGAHDAREEHEVQPHGPIAHVANIHLDPIFEGYVAAPRDLPRTRYLPWTSALAGENPKLRNKAKP